MTPGTKSMVDSGFSAAMMGSFCIPTAGPFIAAALATGQAVFDIVYDQSASQPGQMLVTASDLKGAVNDIKAIVATEVWQNDLANHFDKIVQVNKTLTRVIDGGGAGLDTILKDGIASANFDADWRKSLQEFQDKITDDGWDLYLAATFVEDRPSHAYKAIDFYVFVVGVFILSCKMAVASEMAQILYKNDLIGARNDAATAAAMTKALAWQQQNPGKPLPAGMLTARAAALIDTGNVASASVYVKRFKDNMEDYAGWLDDFCKGVQKIYDDADAAIGKRTAQVSVQARTNGYCYHDDETDTDSDLEDTSFQADLQMKIYIGQITDGLWDDMVTNCGADLVPRDKLASLQTIQKYWAAGRSDAAAFLQTYDSSKAPKVPGQ